MCSATVWIWSVCDEIEKLRPIFSEVIMVFTLTPHIDKGAVKLWNEILLLKLLAAKLLSLGATVFTLTPIVGPIIHQEIGNDPHLA